VGDGNDVRITNFVERPGGVEFSLVWSGEKWGEVRWSASGIFNARNAAMAATAAALALGGREKVSLAPLARFRGVKRRQEKLVERAGLTVIEDFGHHPTAIAETLTSLRARHPGAALTAVFEPRSNTARTKTLQAGFMRALALADEVFIGAVNRADKMKAEERFDAEAVVEHLETQGVHAATAATNAEVLEKLRETVLGGGDAAGASGRRARVVVFFSNGSFDGIIAQFARMAAG
jgi:UDP-N-acetylmuramate: L-alanyl-gamma-D-glutamyl-meso-diaminopimelate ligase